MVESTIKRAIVVFAATLASITVAEREHKVHNIVLYPEKKSWCQITPIQQIVASPGYDSVTIDNNVCVGACYSYSIPKTQPAEPGELIGPYCDSCQPSEMKCYHVNLQRSENTVEGPKLMRKNVQIITNCSCQACDKIRKDDCEISDDNTSELPQNLFTDQKNNNKSSEEIPELLDVNNAPSDYNENQIKFKNKLKKWFISLPNETDQTKNEDNYAKFSNELKTLSADFNSEESLNPDIDAEYDRNEIIVEEPQNPFMPKLELPVKHPAHKQHHTMKKSGESLHNHHLGDEEVMGMDVVHLVKGPHGSIVAAPVEAKFHIDSDALKPNSEGMIINYENHDHKKTEVPNL